MDNKKICCGFDCGGTNLKAYCKIGEKEFTNIIPISESFSKRNLIYEITNFVNSIPVRVDAIGIAFCGIGTSNHIIKSSRKYLQSLDVKDFSHLNCEISLINDSNAATLCGLLEYPNAKVLVGITNGTGIGSGLCINGKLFTGSSGFAGEIHGNAIPSTNGSISIGSVCSGKSLEKLLVNSSLDDRKNIIKHSATNFAMLLTHVINLVNPDIIYLSGGTFKYDNYFNFVLDTLNDFSYDYMTKNLHIVMSTKGIYAGCIGAIENILH